MVNMKRATDDILRKINAVLAAFIACFFLIHALLGVLTQRQIVSSALEALVWVGVAALAVHIAGSIGTTWYMFTDTQRPPSDRKKRHQLLKWITGGVVLGIALYHMLAHGGSAAGQDYLQGVMLLVLLAALTVHSLTGVKSLTRDLGIGKRMRVPIRAALICIAVSIGVVACIVFWL